MRDIAERLEEFKQSKMRTSCTDDRLYGISGKIYELEDLLLPSSYQKRYLTELKERQDLLDERQRNIRELEKKEEHELGALINRLPKKAHREILLAIYFRGETLAEAAGSLYAELIARSGRPADYYTAPIHRMRIRAVNELRKIAQTQETKVPETRKGNQAL